MKRLSRLAVGTGLLSLLLSSTLSAAVVSDVANTKHNLSASGPGTVVADTESQICVFCHTPHGANTAAPGPLWNRQLSTTASYTLYDSESTDAVIEQPGGSSKLCLSCHDGAMTLGKVNVLNGATDVTISMGGVTTMPDGSGALTGFTRNLGTDLSNDHPISFDYDSNLVTADTELYNPLSVTHIAERDPGVTPAVPLENGKVQCVSCHDPHIKDDTGLDIKFLRLNRFQEVASPTDGSFSTDNDIVCLACHNKEGWGNSAHAHPDVADELYTTTAATQRDFPATGTFEVWQAACLNCHDTHTVQGARRLLREGTDSVASPKSGGNPAIEETCYQCHDVQANTILQATGNKVPDIKTDFTTTTYHMPIASSEQNAGAEIHAIGTGADGTEGTQRGQDFVESPDLLGRADLANRHAECTDCHNPHRVIKNRLFNATPTTADAAGTHTHDLAAGETHTNIASGVLAGTTGVEPVYGSDVWGSVPTSYELKRGYAAPGASTAASAPHVTREYQVCLKCHSDYAWATPPTSGPSVDALLNGFGPGVPYTDQAMEFQAPAAHKGETWGAQGAAANHRSWHPVMDNTGRTAAVRKQNNGNAMDHTNFLAPWNDATGATNVGNQTMYCSDCHGSNTGTQTVTPSGGEDGSPWGPHGSNNPFLLKGTWDNETGAAGTADTGICFKCHDAASYSAGSVVKASGFSGTTGTMGAGCNVLTNAAINMHDGHQARVGNLECTWCHTAVPHGWKNKQLLIDISTAGGSTCAGVEPCTDAPYILEGYLGGANTAVNWRASGEWTSADCGGQNWMAQAGGCNNPQ